MAAAKAVRFESRSTLFHPSKTALFEGMSYLFE